MSTDDHGSEVVKEPDEDEVTSGPQQPPSETSISLFDQARICLDKIWVEVRATAVATYTHLLRWTGSFVSWCRLALLNRSLRHAQRAFGEEMFRTEMGDESIRDQIKQLNDDIEAVQSAGQSTRGLAASRRDHVLRLALSVDSSDISDLPGAAGRQLQSLHNAITALENDRQQKAEQEHVWTRPAIIRVVAGYGVLGLLLFVCLVVFTGPEQTQADVATDAEDARAFEDYLEDESSTVYENVAVYGYGVVLLCVFVLGVITGIRALPRNRNAGLMTITGWGVLLVLQLVELYVLFVAYVHEYYGLVAIGGTGVAMLYSISFLLKPWGMCCVLLGMLFFHSSGTRPTGGIRFRTKWPGSGYQGLDLYETGDH